MKYEPEESKAAESRARKEDDGGVSRKEERVPEGLIDREISILSARRRSANTMFCY